MPSQAAVHIDRALSNVSLYYKNVSYIADVISPAISVAKESDKYFVYGKENFRIPAALRADKAETKEITYSLSTDLYSVEDFGYHGLISDRERANSDEALRPDIDMTEMLTDCLMLDREYRVANATLNSANPDWGSVYSTTHFENLELAWDDKATADPRGDIYHAKYVIFKDSRKPANNVLFPVEVAYQLAQMEQIDELRKYTDPGLLTNSGLPPVLWGLIVHEAQSTYDGSVDGGAEAFSETWGNNVVVWYGNPAPIGLKSLTFSITFQRNPFETRKWREEKKKADAVEVSHMYDNKIVAPACGFVYLNVMTNQ